MKTTSPPYLGRALLLHVPRAAELIAGAYLCFMSFRLDRTSFHMGTHAETERYHAAHEPATMAERLRAAAYLTSVAFGYDLANPPRLDRTTCSARQHSQRND